MSGIWYAIVITFVLGSATENVADKKYDCKDWSCAQMVLQEAVKSPLVARIRVFRSDRPYAQVPGGQTIWPPVLEWWVQ